MGRFYSISVTPEGASSPAAQWGSQVPNTTNDDPGALNVQFDFFEYLYGIPDARAGGSSLTIEGISDQDLQQAQQYAGMNIVMLAGMSAGLPLANPAQAGLILKGQIFQAFGNWEGTERTLDFVVVPSVHTVLDPGNFVLTWTKGMSLQDALTTTLGTAYPSVPLLMSIGQYANGYDVNGVYGTLEQLATMIKTFTSQGEQTGVDISMLNNQSLLVTDYSTTQQPIQLDFNDFVGQPTWIQPNVMQITVIMRADIQVGDLVAMPQGLQDAPGIVQTSGASTPSQLKYQAAFQGNFIVQQVRQLGNFRDPNGASWVTVLQAAVQNG